MDQLKKLTTPKNYQKFDNKILGKQFLLGRFYDSTISALVSPACNSKHHNIKKFPKSKIRKLLQTQLKIHQKLARNKRNQKLTLTSALQSEKLKQKKGLNYKPPANQNLPFQYYKPLNSLWRQYMVDLLQKQKNQQNKQLKMLRADFHGGYVTVVGSQNPTLVGLQGIIIKETLRTFEIVVDNVCQKVQQKNLMRDYQRPKQNRRDIKTIIKSICIFLFQIKKIGITEESEELVKKEDASFIINGSSIVYRPSDRIKHKFKFKKAEKLNHSFLQNLSQIMEQQSNIN